MRAYSVESSVSHILLAPQLYVSLFNGRRCDSQDVSVSTKAAVNCKLFEKLNSW